MEITNFDNRCIITPMSAKLDLRQVIRIKKEIENNSDKIIGLNMENVEDCSIDFIEELKKQQNVNLFNINSNIFVLFNVMKIDKFINLYVSQNDFIENKRRIINRCLNVIGHAG